MKKILDMMEKTILLIGTHELAKNDITYENSFPCLARGEGAGIDAWGECDNAQQQNRATHLLMAFYT
jgi:hypothetical protein